MIFKNISKEGEDKIKDLGVKCYCGGSTKYYFAKNLFKCDKTGEWMFFYYKHPCLEVLEV